MPTNPPRTDEAQRDPATLRLHAHADLVPEMRPGEWQAFLADVAEHGIASPLDITPAGVVLDGRHHLRAARELNLRRVPARIVTPQDETGYILRAALQRRHLTSSQIAAIVVGLDDYRHTRRTSRQRQRANLRGSATAEAATLPPPSHETLAGLAHRYGISPRTLADAHTIKRLAPDQLAITNLAIPTTKDAILFLWTISGLLPEAIQVCSAWGFTYKTNLAWLKTEHRARRIAAKPPRTPADWDPGAWSSHTSTFLRLGTNTIMRELRRSHLSLSARRCSRPRSTPDRPLPLRCQVRLRNALRGVSIQQAAGGYLGREVQDGP